jgi:hypothetical protein
MITSALHEDQECLKEIFPKREKLAKDEKRDFENTSNRWQSYFCCRRRKLNAIE